jgi:chaperonin GroES
MMTHGKKIVIQQFLSKTETAGGLALPDTMQTKLPVGKVITCGTEVGGMVKVGDVVQFNPYAGANVNVKGVAYLVIDLDDVLVILQGDEAQYD